MTILDRLASRVGSRGDAANIDVAERCLAKPHLVADIVEGLADDDARVAGDCAEVMVKVAEREPELVAPHAKQLFELLQHDNGRVRYESAHALSLVAPIAARFIGGKLAPLARIVQRDESVIVRDYVIDTILGYAASGPKAATVAFPLLRKAASEWNSKHTARILRGLGDVGDAAPQLTGGIQKLAARFENHSRVGIRKAAKSLLARA